MSPNVWNGVVDSRGSLTREGSGRWSRTPPSLHRYNPSLVALSSGSRIGVYEVIGLLGAGGMGEVYRARDHRLRREVALKVLPDLQAADPDRLARFEREAQLLAALRHTNIATIHGIEDADGVRALVLELVEGPTLDERLRQGALPIPESLRVSRQLVAALDAAHQSGIIHRDLKPSNIKLRTDGTVKVLDFGLARAVDPAGSVPSLPNGSTLTSAGLTIDGTILGTTPYMSPEQARGLAVDRRTDIWAFGCVLYEMLAGRRAFAGKDVSETIAFILTRDPDWTALPAGTPSSIRRLLRRCLAKDHGGRLADIADARLELDDEGDEPHLATTAAPAKRERMAWTAALAVMTLIALAAAFWPEPPVPAAAQIRTDIVTPPSTDPTALAISPDGQKVVFVGTMEGRSRLWLRRLDSAEPAQPLPGTEDARLPFWSPDSRSIGFAADGRLKRIDLDGGAVRGLASAPVFLGGSWNEAGEILFAPFANEPVMVIGPDGGEPRPATNAQPGESHYAPQFLPGGRHFLFYVAGPAEVRGIHLAQLNESGSRRLLDADTAGIYASGDVILFTRRGTLLAQRFDPRRFELIGEAEPLAENIALTAFASGRFAAASASGAGPIVYRTGQRAIERVGLGWFDRTGTRLEQLADDLAVVLNIALSPDNTRLAAFQNGDIWTLDLQRRGPLRRFTFEPSVEFAAIWAPDGSRLIVNSNRHGVYDLFEKPATGASPERELLRSSEWKDATDWSPDGRYVLYRNRGATRAYDIHALEVASRTTFALVQSDADERDARFSRDGRWIAYQSNESGRFEVWVRPFSLAGAARGGKWQISTAGGGQAVWNPAGGELFYLSADARLMSVRIRETADGTGIEHEAPQPLFALPGVNFGRQGTALAPYAVAKDGQRFLFVTSANEPTVSPLTLLQNWRPGGQR
jgi:Tol biopolymer transport system component